MKKIFVVLVLVITTFKAEAQSSAFDVEELLLKGNYQEALKILNNTDKSSLVYDKMAAIYQSIGDHSKAIENWKKALSLEEKDSFKVKLGQVYQSAGMPNNAMEIYEEIIAKDTSNLLVAHNLGKLYLANRKSKSAEKLYRFLKTRDPLNPNYPFQLGKALDRQKKKLQMGQSYLDAYNLDTLHIRSMYELAKFFKELRYKDSTMLFINKGLEIDSLQVNFLQLKANQLYFQKEFEATLEVIAKLEKLNFRSVNTYEMAGMCHVNLEQPDAAEKYFRKALRVDRNHPKIYYRLGSLAYDKKEYKNAELYLMQSIMMGKPETDKQYLLLGVISSEKKEYKQALRFFEDGIKNNRSNHKLVFQKALTEDAYYKDKKIALETYNHFIKRFDKKDPELTAFALSRIKELKRLLFIDGVQVEE